MSRSSVATPKGHLFLLDVPFALRRTAQGAGARWDDGWRGRTWRGERLPEGLLPFRPPPYSLERLLEDRANHVRRAPSRPLKKVAPHSHQEEAIAFHQNEVAEDNTPHVLVIRDVRWSVIQMEQTEGRTHRDGKFALAYWTFVPGAIDERILEVVLANVRTTRTMQGDETETTRAIEVALFGESP